MHLCEPKVVIGRGKTPKVRELGSKTELNWTHSYEFRAYLAQIQLKSPDLHPKFNEFIYGSDFFNSAKLIKNLLHDNH